MVNSKARAGEKFNGKPASEWGIPNSSEAFKSGFEKMVRGYDHLFGYGRETMDAYIKSANAAGKGAETIGGEIYAYSRQSVEDSISAAKALIGSKSVHEAFELQGDFVKAAFDAYVSEVTKLSEIAFATARDAITPLQGRVQAWVDVVERARAA